MNSIDKLLTSRLGRTSLKQVVARDHHHHIFRGLLKLFETRNKKMTTVYIGNLDINVNGNYPYHIFVLITFFCVFPIVLNHTPF